MQQQTHKPKEIRVLNEDEQFIYCLRCENFTAHKINKGDAVCLLCKNREKYE